MRAKDIFDKPLTEKQEAMLRKLRDTPDSEINYGDIPPLTDEQMADAVTIRPNLARKYVGVRIDPDVLLWLKQYGPGHSTRINQILRTVMLASQGKQQSKH